MSWGMFCDPSCHWRGIVWKFPMPWDNCTFTNKNSRFFYGKCRELYQSHGIILPEIGPKFRWFVFWFFASKFVRKKCRAICSCRSFLGWPLPLGVTSRDVTSYKSPSTTLWWKPAPTAQMRQLGSILPNNFSAFKYQMAQNTKHVSTTVSVTRQTEPVPLTD